MVGDRLFRRIYSACWDPEVRLQEIGPRCVAMQVISATPVLFAYERPLEQAWNLRNGSTMRRSNFAATGKAG